MKTILFLLFTLPLFAMAQSFPNKPLNYITDSADVLSSAEEKVLNKKLHRFEDSTSSQIYVYIVSSLNGKDMSDLCQEIFVQWKVGQKGKNNGVLIGIFVNDHKFRIHTGYGMEGSLPDLLTKKIQDEDMRPSFKQQKYYEGIFKGTDKLIYYSKHEYKPTAKEADSEDTILGMLLLYFFAALVYTPYFFLVRYVCKERKAAKITLLIIGGVFFLIPFFGLFVLCFMLFVMAIIALVKLASKASGGFSSGGGSYTSSNNDSSWSSSSSSSDSNYSSSSSSDSDSSFSGGGGGDSGGGGSNSDW